MGGLTSGSSPMCLSSQRMHTAKMIPNRTQTIHPGKKDPSMLNVGARWQPVTTNRVSETNGMRLGFSVERVRFMVADRPFLAQRARDPHSETQCSRFG